MINLLIKSQNLSKDYAFIVKNLAKTRHGCQQRGAERPWSILDFRTLCKYSK